MENLTPPTITLKGDSSITVPASVPYVDPGYTAIDNTDRYMTGRVVITGMVNTDTLGDYTIHYDMSDRLGGNYTIYGDAGYDMLYAGPNTDAIYGGPGTDTIESGENGTVHDDDSERGG